MFDIIVIGGGVIGCMILRELSKYDVDICLLEKNDDVATGASRANSGIVHAGYDCVPGTYKARFNVEGNAMFDALCDELDVPFARVGSVVVAPEARRAELEELLSRAVANHVDARIVEREELLRIEPNVADSVDCALYAPSAGIVSPYKLTIHAADQAVLNGARVVLSAEVTAVKYVDHHYVIQTTAGEFESRIIINAAGYGAVGINKISGTEVFPKAYTRGDYFVLDTSERKNINTVIFPLPDERGKGILVAPTADGNVIYGPSSFGVSVGTDTATTADSLDYVRSAVARIYRRPNFSKVIRVYGGVRTASGSDFIIKRSHVMPNFIYLQGICSPGLTAAPSIAKYVVAKCSVFVSLKEKADYKPLPKTKRFATMSDAERETMFEHDSAWGRIICRCEHVTEAEIVNAIHSPVPATTVDAVKRRVRAGMGRCQGGFCMPRVMEILSKELDIPMTAVKKGGEGSEIAKYSLTEVVGDEI